MATRKPHYNITGYKIVQIINFFHKFRILFRNHISVQLCFYLIKILTTSNKYNDSFDYYDQTQMGSLEYILMESNK